MDPEAARTIGRLEGKLDALTTIIGEIKEMVADKHGDLENRLRSLEQRQWWFAGVAAVIAWLAPHLIDVKALFTKLP